MLHNHCYIHFSDGSLTTTSTGILSGIEPSKLIETLAASPCSLHPNTSADRLATEPSICSRVDSSLIPSNE